MDFELGIFLLQNLQPLQSESSRGTTGKKRTSKEKYGKLPFGKEVKWNECSLHLFLLALLAMLPSLLIIASSGNFTKCNHIMLGTKGAIKEPECTESADRGTPLHQTPRAPEVAPAVFPCAYFFVESERSGSSPGPRSGHCAKQGPATWKLSTSCPQKTVAQLLSICTNV